MEAISDEMKTLDMQLWNEQDSSPAVQDSDGNGTSLFSITSPKDLILKLFLKLKFASRAAALLRA